MASIVRTIYFCFSFGFLLGRTAAVSLSAASVHDESLLPAPVLYSVNTSSYSTEVIIFNQLNQLQIAQDKSNDKLQNYKDRIN